MGTSGVPEAGLKIRIKYSRKKKKHPIVARIKNGQYGINMVRVTGPGRF
jgi:hypothetical protein